tara:strand:+ start:4345 stop:4665 length:321 start_codon:yes stop_codon:yes gene_type:complete
LPYRNNTPQEKLVQRVIEEAGLSFEYQVPVGQYTLDFYLPEFEVAVEADGPFGHHKKKDFDRTMHLVDLGAVRDVWRIKSQTLGKIREEFQAYIDKELQLWQDLAN